MQDRVLQRLQHAAVGLGLHPFQPQGDLPALGAGEVARHAAQAAEHRLGRNQGDPLHPLAQAARQLIRVPGRVAAVADQGGEIPPQAGQRQVEFPQPRFRAAPVGLSGLAAQLLPGPAQPPQPALQPAQRLRLPVLVLQLPRQLVQQAGQGIDASRFDPQVFAAACHRMPLGGCRGGGS